MKKDNLSEFKKMEALIKETKNDKLLYAFYNFYDNELKSSKEELDKLSVEIKNSESSNTKSYLNSEKSLQELHDLKIDIELEKKQMQDEMNKIRLDTYEYFKKELDGRSKEMMNQLYWKLTQMQYSMITHPRLLGLMLLIRGSSMVYDLKNIKRPEIEFIKFQGRLDSESKSQRKPKGVKQ